MSRVRGRDTKPELALRRELWKRGLRYRLHVSDLPGRPDLVFTRQRVAVFVDSDWWHGRIIRESGEDELRKHLRGHSQDWWVKKLCRNVERDDEVTLQLRELEWTVVRVWESELLENTRVVADNIETILQECD